MKTSASRAAPGLWDAEEPWIMDEALDAAGLTKTTSEVTAELDGLLAVVPHD